MPSEPAESNFRTKVHATAYAAREAGGIIWAYMGSRQDNPPGMPQFEWCNLPADQVQHGYKGIYECNYMQGLEGDIDSAHLYFLHSRLPDEASGSAATHLYSAPKLDVVETNYGVYYGASREQAPGQTYWRTAQFVFPIFTMFPASADGAVPSHMYTPIDDNLTMHWGVRWHPTRKLEGGRQLDLETIRQTAPQGMGAMKEVQQGRIFAHWWPEAEIGNDFLIDREEQRTRTFTGIPTVRLQDAAMIVSMGGIYNRTREHLGTTDAMIIATRRKLIRAAKALRDTGEAPPASENPASYFIRSGSCVLPSSLDWKEAMADWHFARTTVPPAETYKEMLEIAAQ
jgi:phenylpropionate dioxygenase-like ring-hydroxylating dioxygenase large terminal subunit